MTVTSLVELYCLAIGENDMCAVVGWPNPLGRGETDNEVVDTGVIVKAVENVEVAGVIASFFIKGSEAIAVVVETVAMVVEMASLV